MLIASSSIHHFINYTLLSQELSPSPACIEFGQSSMLKVVGSNPVCTHPSPIPITGYILLVQGQGLYHHYASLELQTTLMKMLQLQGALDVTYNSVIFVKINKEIDNKNILVGSPAGLEQTRPSSNSNNKQGSGAVFIIILKTQTCVSL